MTMPAVVYAVRPGDSNEELRYSLRSLTNLDHDRVVIAGHCPPWVTNVEHIPTVQTGTKYERAAANWRAACEALDEPFLMFNDDFFVMRPTKVRVWHRGPLDDVIRYYERIGSSRYLTGMRATRDLLDRLGYDAPLSYGLHVPMLVGPKLWLAACDLAEPGTHLRTLYGNLNNLGGTEIEDVKVGGQRLYNPTLRFLSTCDDSWRRHPIGAHIRARFPTPCQYETP